MADFLKKLYAGPFVAATWGWLAVSGFFVYFYFCVVGFNDKKVRSFIYFQGRVLQMAVLFASVFHKKIIVKAPLPSRPSILVANHPCTYDTFVFFDFGIKNLVCIAKGWPFKIPFYGTFIKKAGYINSDNKTAEQIIEEVKDRFSKGLHIGIFPEGTRSLKTGRFRSLAFEISIKTGADIVPFVIKGLGQMLPPGAIWAKKANIKYIQLKPVSPTNFQMEGAALKMAQHVKALIVENL
jgi:1-acyl-sn-glycerol-3-phosphate acyltransferase